MRVPFNRVVVKKSIMDTTEHVDIAGVSRDIYNSSLPHTHTLPGPPLRHTHIQHLLLRSTCNLEGHTHSLVWIGWEEPCPIPALSLS